MKLHRVLIPVLLLGIMAIASVSGSAQQDPNLVIEPVFLASDMPDGVMREAMTFDFASDGTIFMTERRGYVNQINPYTKERFEILNLSEQAESFHMGPGSGLIGLALEPGFDFEEKNHIYLVYSPIQWHRNISVFEYKIGDDGVPYIDVDTERVIYQWDILISKNTDSRHVAGDIRFGPDGKLYVAIGDETASGLSQGHTPIDERPGMEHNNAQLTAGNPLHPAGSVLRLNPDGTIPEDNPFVGVPGILDEIFARGYRNPFRIHVDPVTGWVLAGENDHDTTRMDPNRGPRGMSGWSIATGGENFGWPYCTGPNEPFMKYDFATSESFGPFDCRGMTPDVVWLTKGQEHNFPQLGSGGSSPISGVILRQPAADAKYQWSDQYLNHWYAGNFSRGHIIRIKLEEDGTKMPPLADFYAAGLEAPSGYNQTPVPEGLEVDVWVSGFTNPIDIRQSPDGALYVLSMGRTWRAPNADAGIYRIYDASATN